jgi:hypothetical protein
VPVEEDTAGSWLQLAGSNGAVVTIGKRSDSFHDGYDFVDFPLTISADGLSAMSSVRSVEGSSPMSLRRFLRALADDWRGEQGEQTWESIEHDLTIEARRRPGYVDLGFILRESYRTDAWTVRAVVAVEAGEEMARVARVVEVLLDSA